MKALEHDHYQGEISAWERRYLLPQADAWPRRQHCAGLTVHGNPQEGGGNGRNVGAGASVLAVEQSLQFLQQLTGSTTPQHVTVTFAEPIDPAATPYLTTELMFNFGSNASPARFQVFALSGNDDGSPHPAAITAILTSDPAARTPEQAAQLRDYFHQIAPEKAESRSQIENLTERLSMLTEKHSMLVMNTSAKPRVTHILNRGVYSSPMEEVTPGSPAALPPLSDDPAFDKATGTVDTATGAATIQWTGTFTINFYGRYVPFWIENPKLVIDSSGSMKEESSALALNFETFLGQLTSAEGSEVPRETLGDAVDNYVRESTENGSIIDYQLTQMKLGRMAMLIQAGRQFSYEVAKLMAAGQGQLEASMVKAYVCKAAEWVTREAMQIHGGMGYAEEYKVSRYFVDARVLSIFEGADETLCLKVIARRMLDAVK